MNDLKLKRKEIKDENGDTIRLIYNETEDMLDIFFNANLMERTEYGPRSYPLDKLEELPEDLRNMAVHAIMTKPVDKFLKISFFQGANSRRVPLTYVETNYFASVA